jgi:anaerobic selenocysteine-containing dehydrogenase
MDHGGCGLLVHVEDGKIVKVEGDPDSPLNKGTLCAKGIAQVERLNHPERLRHPMKRAGARGEGKWERIPWEQALSTIAQKIQEKMDPGEGRGIAFAQGGYKLTGDPLPDLQGIKALHRRERRERRDKNKTIKISLSLDGRGSG